MKEFDLAVVLSQLEPLIKDETILLPLLNGMDVHRRVRDTIHNGVVLPACVYVGTHIERPGKVVQQGGACTILFGPDPQVPNFVPDEITKLFDQARIKSEWTTHVRSEIWNKFIFICAYGLITAAYDKTVGEVFADDRLRGDVRAIMVEAAVLAKASGVRLPDDVVEESLIKARSFPFEAKTSFQRDFERTDRPDERNLFAGSMIRLATELGIEVQKTNEITQILEERKPLVRVSAGARTHEQTKAS